MINSEYMMAERAHKPQQANEPCLGFAIPLAGAANHAYLWRLYQGLAPLRRKLITKWCMPGGWVSADDSDVLLLSKKNIMWKCANRCWRGGCDKARKLAGHSMEVPQPPLGWQRRLHHFIDEFNMSGLMITYGGFGVSLLPELERTDVPVSMVFGGSDALYDSAFFSGELETVNGTITAVVETNVSINDSKVYKYQSGYIYFPGKGQ